MKYNNNAIITKITITLLVLTIVSGCFTRQLTPEERKREEELQTARNIEIAKSYQQKGFHDVAVDFLNTAIKKSPNKMELYLLQANSKMALNQMDVARELYIKALSDKSLKVQTFNRLGQLYLKTNRPIDALTVLRQSVAFRPTYFGLYRLGVAYDMIKKHKMAEKSYIKALKIKPMAQEAINNLALSYAFSNRLDKGINLLLDVIKKYPVAKIYNNLSILYWKKGDIEKARSYMIYLTDAQVKKNLRIMTENRK